MALPILAGFALRGIGNLISRRRALRGASFGRAMNTKPQGPPQTPITQAATQGPKNTPGVIAGGAQIPRIGGPKDTPGIVAGGAQIPNRSGNATIGSGFGGGPTIGTVESGRGQIQTQEVLSGQSIPRQGGDPIGRGGEATALGEASIARSRRRNRQQQATLSNQALR